MVFRLRRTLRPAFLLLGVLALSTGLVMKWPGQLGSLPRFVLSQVVSLSWVGLKSQRVIGLRVAGFSLMIPAWAVGPLHVLVLAAFVLWIAAEVLSRSYWAVQAEAALREMFRRQPRVAPPRPLEYASPVVEAALVSVGGGRREEPPLKTSGPGEAEELEAAVARLEVGDANGAIRLLEPLSRRATHKMDLVRYWLAMAYAANRQPEMVRATMHGLPTAGLPPQRRYKLAVMLDQARLYDLALGLYEGLLDEAKRYPDIKERLTRVREVMYEGGTEAFDRQLVGMLDGRYTNAKVLASGGMGVVFTAWEADPGRKVAIKMLSPFLRNDVEAQKRFLREGSTLQELAHPNLVRTFHVHTSPVPHYSMELLNGSTLQEIIQTQAPLPVSMVKSLSLEMLTGLAFCHARDVIHRDIKPANVVVPQSGALKIIDFGLVRLGLSTGITVEGTVLGTPAYMPPEQLRGDEVDRTADLYSFGIALYEMATGKLPFPPGEEMTRNIIAGKYRAASEMRPELGDAFDALMARLIHRDKGARFPAAEEVAVELGKVLAG